MGKAPGLRLMVFDLDGTLVEEPSSWSKIHQHFGTQTVERRNLRAYSRGDITYDEFAVRDIEAWPRATHLDDIWRILQDYRYVPGARACLEGLKKMGLLTAIVSAGLDLLASAVADDLAIDYVLANGLEVDEEGYLTGKGITRVEPLKKDLALDTLLQRIGLRPSQVAAVGDTKFDAGLLRLAAVGFSLGTDEELVRVAQHSISTLTDVPEILSDRAPKS